MEKAVTSGFSEAFWQNMEHQQVKKIFTGDCFGLILFGFGLDIPERDHAVFAFNLLVLLVLGSGHDNYLKEQMIMLDLCQFLYL